MQPLFDITVPIIKVQKYPFKCENCEKTFLIDGKWIALDILCNKSNKHKYCSKTCQSVKQVNLIDTVCEICLKTISIHPCEKKKSKSGKSFCSRSCAAKYNNTHKTTGNRRSKLEIWLEQQLTSNFSQLEILYNDKTTINSELDIYIPLLKLAIELNGIFHYEPIYGLDKLASIQNNDGRKFQACLEKNIELVIIDSSSFKNFKEKNALKYYQIIENIITSKMVSSVGIAPTTSSLGGLRSIY